ncbi:MAG: hypothetical protein KGL35_25360 [Bradyrhizobium sp.]|nr:hypothetical protein [Bradyrhizobium sp.]
MTRRERAMRAAFAKYPGPSASFKLGASFAIDAYEAELAADLENDETVLRALDAAQGLPGFYERGQRVGPDSMRAALRSVLETKA